MRLGPVLISGSKEKQNKPSLLASAYKYRVNLPCSNITTGYVPPTAFGRGSHFKCVYLQNPSWESGTRGSRTPTTPPAVPSLGEMETPGHRAGGQGGWKWLLQMGSGRRGSSTEKGRGRNGREKESSVGTRTCHSEWC